MQRLNVKIKPAFENVPGIRSKIFSSPVEYEEENQINSGDDVIVYLSSNQNEDENQKLLPRAMWILSLVSCMMMIKEI